MPQSRRPRRKFRGRTVGPDGKPRSHEGGGNRQARAGFTMGDTAAAAVPTKFVKGEFRVPAPTKRIHRGITRNATTGEIT